MIVNLEVKMRPAVQTDTGFLSVAEVSCVLPGSGQKMQSMVKGVSATLAGSRRHLKDSAGPIMAALFKAVADDVWTDPPDEKPAPVKPAKAKARAK
jgi:hypothetical protein